MKYIDDRIYNIKNLSEISKDIGYNYSYLSMLFKKVHGTTLSYYFRSKRMEEAKKLLKYSNIKITKIAKMLNYSNVYAFSKAFKTHFGESPKHYFDKLHS